MINATGIHVHSQHMAEISYKRQSVAIVIYYFISDAHTSHATELMCHLFPICTKVNGESRQLERELGFYFIFDDIRYL